MTAVLTVVGLFSLAMVYSSLSARWKHRLGPKPNSRQVGDVRRLGLDLRDTWVEQVHVSIRVPSGVWFNGLGAERDGSTYWLELPNQSVPDLVPGRYHVRWYLYGGQLGSTPRRVLDTFDVSPS